MGKREGSDKDIFGVHGLFAAGGYGVACQDKRGKQGLWEEPAAAVDLSSFMGFNEHARHCLSPVSYTHLTLPTKA